MTATETSTRLIHDTAELFAAEPALSPLFGYDPSSVSDIPRLFASVLSACLPEGTARQSVRKLAEEAFRDDTQAVDAALTDLAATTARDIDPRGMAGALHFAHGYHVLLAYRLTNALWRRGRHSLSLAVKGQFTRALGADIMPQARIGRGVWLDHGLGVVIGQTAVIEDDVSLWHGVTLGSTLADRGEQRHPWLRRGATIGAGAVILGGIEIGAGAVVAAGAVVTRPVPPGGLVSGPRAEPRERRPGGFQGFAPADRIGRE
ncbi:serine O-acetyltransferase [Paracoccus alkanivorans]|uniref:Serine acetyltransferase n=1 Tax=Paracoccus alkanivorans TaxID=2116655 RepID=A0A3M0MK41_9RHOB|nr:serine acetyltransferase [Paracoccus alkanivorans]RMC37971.1 serine acetyltransferase [Paracoccus alkanivorans]